MKPVVDRLEAEYGDEIEFVIYDDIDSDADGGELASTQGVNGVPTIVIVGADGTEVERIIGSRDEETVRESLEAVR